MFDAWVVAAGFVLGGLGRLWVEARQRRGARPRIDDVDAIRGRDALAVGLIQCLALFPGVSRSGA
ncbi:UNVERIFIED_CONTAM: undecaprenyl-diphosphatase, partial [Salmonella enterica subsp. enterica serovar Weltevreden]